MGEAFFWGAVGASSLLVGAVVAYVASPSRRFIAIVMALGAGLLIGSVAFELIDEALQIAEVGRVGLFMLIGAATFTLGNWYLDRRGAGDRKDSSGAQEDGSPLAIVFGSILDGIPESFVLGLTVLEGGVSVGLLMGVLLSNLPEGMSSSAGMRIAGWPRGRVFGMWLAVAVVSGLSAALGYQLLGDASGHSGAFAQGFAAGALLAMVADTMLPEAYEVEQGFTGSLVAVGFAISLILSSL
jgi:ZIP family zinc transporter